jgi:CRP/FNR family cyclic AMP-dependent transcriptional regulator
MNPQAIPTVPLFSSTGRRDRQTIARLADTVDVPARKTLTREGDLASEFFVILDGMAVASRDGEPVAILGPGDFFGEIGLLDGPRRTATVAAETPMELVVVGSREFRSLLEAFPAIRAEIKAAAAERREGSDRLAA